jgi:predicted deacylase
MECLAHQPPGGVELSHLKIGSASARPGEITTGWFDAVSLPTGSVDRFPVMIGQGSSGEGPVIWITASIHGREHSGLAVIHQLFTPDLIASLHGTIVAVPTLNPAGLRIGERTAYYQKTDPNRLFPAPDLHPKPPSERHGHSPASNLEMAYQNLYNAIVKTRPFCLIDLHNAWFGSIPFVFRDPVFFHRKRGSTSGAARTRMQAEALQNRVGELLEAFGFTVINEFVADSYITKKLHRSVSGSLLNRAGVPAFTVELGSEMYIDQDIVKACVTGIRNVMRKAGMLPGAPEPIANIPIRRPGFAVRRQMHPYAPQAGIIRFLVAPGETITKGQPLAQITDIFGRPLGESDGILTSDYDGFVVGWPHGVIRYQGEPVMVLAIRDTNGLVTPYPD